MDGSERDLNDETMIDGLPIDEVFHVKLRKPITYANVTYEQLTFREPTTGELRKAAMNAETPMALTVNLAQVVAAVPMRVIEQLPASEFYRVQNFFGKFVTDNPETGRT